MTQGNRLTESEYKRGDEDFQLLLKTPWESNEPCYIVPEFGADGNLHPQLELFKTALGNGLPYHLFITESYGAVWPTILRLALGLSDGYQISPQQFRTMMKIAYWRELGLTITTSSFFGEHNRNLSEFAQHLVDCMYFPSAALKNKFIANMRKSDMPVAEQHVIVIELNANYLRYAISHLMEHNFFEDVQQLIHYDSAHNQALYGKYNHKQARQHMLDNAAQMFAKLLTGFVPHYKISIINDKPYLILPSITMQQVYCQTINPKRKLQGVSRAGQITPAIMEYHSDRNERAANSLAPGMTNLSYAHGTNCSPALLAEHDDYHLVIEGLLSLELYQYISAIKNFFHRWAGAELGLTSEIYRAIDREKVELTCSDSMKAMNILHALFVQRESANTTSPQTPLAFSLSQSSNITSDISPSEDQLTSALLEKTHQLSGLLLLTDMVTQPQQWPLFTKLQTNIIKLLSSCLNKRPAPEIIVENINRYWLLTKGNHLLTSVCLLCEVYLEDKGMAQTLINMSQTLPKVICVALRKMEHGHLYPVIIVNAHDYTFDQLLAMSASQRQQLMQTFSHVMDLQTARLPAWEQELIHRVQHSEIVAKYKMSFDDDIQSMNRAINTACEGQHCYTALSKLVKQATGESSALTAYRIGLKHILLQWHTDYTMALLRHKVLQACQSQADAKQASEITGVSFSLSNSTSSVAISRQRLLAPVLSATNMQDMATAFVEIMQSPNAQTQPWLQQLAKTLAANKSLQPYLKSLQLSAPTEELQQDAATTSKESKQL